MKRSIAFNAQTQAARERQGGRVKPFAMTTPLSTGAINVQIVDMGKGAGIFDR